MMEVVIVTHNSARHIGPCLDSVYANGASAIVVDNVSTDRTIEIVREKYPSAKILQTGGNVGYGKAMNLGFRETSGEFVVLSNPDVVYAPDAIPKMVKYLATHPGTGIVGPQQTFPDGQWQRSYGDLPSIGSGLKDALGITTLHNWIRRTAWPRAIDGKPKEVPYVDGAVLMVRRQVFASVGGFDEAFYFYGDESDLCARLKKSGWRVVFLPAARAVHVRGGDSIQVDRSDKFLRYMVNSQAMLARKHLSPRHARFYMWCEKICFARLALTYRFVQLLPGNRENPGLAYKSWMFNSYVKIWREQLRTRNKAQVLRNFPTSE